MFANSGVIRRASVVIAAVGASVLAIAAPASAATLDVAPNVVITGGNTGINFLWAVDLGLDGRIWGINHSGTVNMWSQTATGNAAPDRSLNLRGTNGSQHNQYGLAHDGAGNVYTIDYNNNVVEKFNEATITGAANGSTVSADIDATVVNPLDVVAYGNYVFVTSVSSNTVEVFETSNLGAFASVSISAPNSGGTLANIRAIEIRGGEAYISTWNGDNSQIWVVAVADIIASGQTGGAPSAAITASRIINGASAGIAYPASLAVACDGSLFASNYGDTITGQSVVHHAAGATGNATPLTLWQGVNTGFDHPLGIAVTDGGRTWVANTVSLVAYDNSLTCSSSYPLPNVAASNQSGGNNSGGAGASSQSGSVTSLSNTGRDAAGTALALVIGAILLSAGVALRYARRSIQ